MHGAQGVNGRGAELLPLLHPLQDPARFLLHGT